MISHCRTGRRSASVVATAALVSCALTLAGCAGRPGPAETGARRHAIEVGAAYRPGGRVPTLAKLTNDSTLGDYLRVALFNQPRIEAAYQEWVASVERITLERSLPDPRFTFELDINNVVQAVMPGLFSELPGPAKLGLRAEAASAESRRLYFTFENAILQTVLSFKRAYYQNHFLSERLHVTRQTLELAVELENLARKQNEVGKATLQDVLRAQIEQDKLKAEIANLEDSRAPLRAQMKAALGLGVEQPDPPAPTRFETTPLTVDGDHLLRTALAHNPRLKAMAADIDRAEVSLRLAYKVKVPDFSVGLEADALSSPALFKPQIGFTLPIWRDKNAATVAAARADQKAAQARLAGEQVALAVEVAEKTFMVRETTRNLNLLEGTLLSRARLSLEVARGGYVAGKTDFLNVLDAWRVLLDFELSAVQARTQRELALAELSLAIVGTPPPGLPVLTK